jgi:hypothetical protein
VLALPFLPLVYAWRGLKWLSRATARALVWAFTPVRLLWTWLVVWPLRQLWSVLAEPLRTLGRAIGRALLATARALRPVAAWLYWIVRGPLWCLYQAAVYTNRAFRAVARALRPVTDAIGRAVRLCMRGIGIVLRPVGLALALLWRAVAAITTAVARAIAYCAGLIWVPVRVLIVEPTRAAGRVVAATTRHLTAVLTGRPSKEYSR